jgi:5-formyltetrahydrofolate cyclo-ligase
MVDPPTFSKACNLPDSENKSDLRRQFRSARDAFVAGLSDGERAIAFSRLPSPLASLCSAGKIVAGYIPIGSEANPVRLMLDAQAQGCSLALPFVTSKASPMRFLAWDGSAPLQPGPFGLQQPAENAPELTPDVILVPLVAFDQRLMRLGQGAGHYDRALSLLGNAVAVGVAYSVQETELLAADPWDVPMDAILTEKSWIGQ